MLIKKVVFDFLQILPLWLLILVSKTFSCESRKKVGGIWFKLLLIFSKKLYLRIEKNLQIAFPNLNSAEKKLFIKKFAYQAGMTFTELMFNSDFHKNSNQFYFNSEELLPLFIASKEKRPIIIVSAHFGPWEAIRAVLKNNNLTSGAIYKKNKNQFYETIHLKAIKAGGEPIFPIGFNGTKEMIKYLKTGGVISVLLDQAAEDGEFFDFMGRPAKTSTSIAKLAIKLNALVVPAYAVRQDTPSKISVYFEEPLNISTYQIMTEQINKSIIARITRNPTQWYWLHRRWKYS